MNQTLFDKGDAVHPSPGEVAAAQTMVGNPRLRVPQRNQVEMHWTSLDELLEPDHPARMVWAFVCGLDLGYWLTTIKAVEGVAGRDATDPRLLVALWIYATIEGVGSARELERLCEKHLAFQWLCGGVSVNYHLLSDFRSQSGDKWDDLLTQIVASLLAEKLVTLKRVAQDGMRVRASAGRRRFGASRVWSDFWRRPANRSRPLNLWRTSRSRMRRGVGKRLADVRRRSGNDAWKKPLVIATTCSSNVRKQRKSPGKSRSKREPRRPIPRLAR